MDWEADVRCRISYSFYCIHGAEQVMTLSYYNHFTLQLFFTFTNIFILLRTENKPDLYYYRPEHHREDHLKSRCEGVLGKALWLGATCITSRVSRHFRASGCFWSVFSANFCQLCCSAQFSVYPAF